MLSIQLKELTKINHQLLEKKLVAQMKAINNIAAYSKLLELFYSFFGGLEVAMGKHPDLSFLPDQAERRKSTALANDLKALGTTLPVLATGIALPTIENNLQTIGAMYVMEGSTLGGKFIAKMISKQLNMEDAPGVSFFKGYGEATESMWQKFKESIDALPITATEEAIVITSANNTFLQFSQWFDAHQ